MKIDIEIDLTPELKKKLKLKNQTPKEYVDSLINKDLHSIIPLENGFYYNQATSRLYNNQKQEVKLTRLEQSLFEQLLKSDGAVCKIEEIHAVSWKGKKMTRFTLRNKVKSLRNKTYYDLIKNHSNIGYSMNFPKQ